MANYLSKPADYGNYTQPINLDLVNFVMQSRQQKYDYNLAKLESKITDELGSIDLARTKDKEYFLNRANDILGSAGDLSNIDFSVNENAKQLDNRINSIVDDRVLNDVVSTANLRAFQRTVQAKQAEDPELYDQKNVAYAMEKQGANAWLKGDSDKLGTVTYQDYTDVGAELKDISENLDKYANVVKENTPEGMYFKNIEGEYLTANEIRQIASQQLSDKAKSQMQINGWASYDGGNAKAQGKLKEEFGRYSEARVKEIDNIIADKKLQLKSLGDASSQKKDDLNAEVEELTDNRRVTKEAYDSWIKNGSFDSMSSTLEQDRVLGSFANTFAFDNRGITYSNNAAALALQKLQMQAALKQQAGAGGIEGASVIEMFGDTPDRQEFQNTLTQAEKWETNFNQGVMTEFNKLGEAEQKAVLSNFKEGTGQTKEEYILNYMEKLPGNKVVNNITLSRLDELRLKKDNYRELYNSAIKRGVEESEASNIKEVVAEYYDNKGIKMLDDSGKVVSVAEYLAQKGISRGNGDLLNDPKYADIKKNVLKQYYADKILSSPFMSKDAMMTVGKAIQSMGFDMYTTPLTAGVGVKLQKESQSLSEEDTMMMERLVELTGSVEAADNYIKNSKEKGLYNDNRFVDSLYRALPPLAYLTSTIPEEFGGSRDNSVVEDSTINNWVTLDKIKEYGGNYLNNEKFRPGKRPQALSISIGSPLGTAIAGVITSGIATTNGQVSQIDMSKTAGNLAVYESGPDTVIVSGRHKVKGVWQPFETEIMKNNLPAEFSQAITFETERNIFDRTNMKPTEGKVEFKTTDDRRGFLDAEYFTGDPELALGITKDGLLDNLYGYFPSVMGSAAQPSVYANAITNMIDSNNVFATIDKEDDGEFYIAIKSKNLKNGSPEVIFSEKKPIAEADYDEAYRKIKRIPQLYVAELLQKAVRQAQLDPQNPSPTMKNILKLYGQ